MTSLQEIKDKLDAIKEQLRIMDAGLHETAMRNHVQLLEGQKAISQRLDAKDNAKFLSNMESMKPVPRKARKKARRAVGKAR
jgi:ABC-type Na+ transport system ATPase subunit NatA